jgi:Tol biopolymer transport system component
VTTVPTFERRFVPLGRLAAILVGLAVLMGGEVWAVAPDRPSPSELPAPTPESQKVIEGVTHGHRWLIDIRDGSAMPLPLSLRPIWATGYAVSPDGRRVVFMAPDPEGTDGSMRIYIANVDGSDVEPLSAGGVAAWDPAWSPDSRNVVYVDESGLALVGLRTHRVRRFARVPAGGISRPTFRPDGRVIGFTRDSGEIRHLWTVPARGGRSTRLIEDASHGSWSPQGDAIAFESSPRQQRELGVPSSHNDLPFYSHRAPRVLWLADADGASADPIAGTRTRLAPHDESADRGPAWSPDGRRIAYGAGGHVRVVDMRTGGVRDLSCGRRPTWWDARHVLVEGDITAC